MEKTILISQEEINQLITMKDILQAVDKTFVGLGDGTSLNPTKVTLDFRGEVPGYDGYINAMPAYVGWCDIAGIKWAGGWHNRPSMGLPFISSMILLINPSVGNFIAVMDGELITTLRTGAQAAVAAKYLRSGKGKNLTMGLFGCGAQGHMQTKAFAELFDIQELRIYDMVKEVAVKYKDEMKEYVKGEIVVCDSAEEVCAGTPDVLVSFTHADDKFIKDEWMKPGQILFPMGSFTEVDDKLLLTADKILVDHVGQCMHRGALADVGMSGQLKESDLFGTIGEVACGKKSCENIDNERIVCVPIGTGAMDIGVASIVYHRALEQGVGGEYKFV